MIWNGLPLIIFGSGGISKEVYQLIKNNNIVSNYQSFDFIGFVEHSDSEIGKHVIDNYTVISSDRDIYNFTSKYPILGIVIPIGNPNLKSLIYEKVKNIPNVVFPNIIHNRVSLNKDTINMGEGNIITEGVKLTCNINMGNFNLINLNSTIGHDTDIGDFNVINPLVAISGNVVLRDKCLIGTGANILQGITIDSATTVGAGAVVIKDVKKDSTVVGVPAKNIKIK